MWPEQSQKPQQDTSTPHERPSSRGASPEQPPVSPQTKRPHFWEKYGFKGGQDSPTDFSSSNDPRGQLSPGAVDRVFPIRSVVSVDPAPTPSAFSDRSEGYFHSHGRASDGRRRSATSESDTSHGTPTRPGRSSFDQPTSSRPQPTLSESRGGAQSSSKEQHSRSSIPRLAEQIFSGSNSGSDGDQAQPKEGTPSLESASSIKSKRNSTDDMGGLVTARFKHIISEGGHHVITGRDGETLQRCEDEPIHIPGAVQGYGLLIALQEEADGKLAVRIVSENSKAIIGYTPKQLFALESFTDILSEDQADNLLDHIDFIREEDADVAANGPEVFTLTVRTPKRKPIKMWCAIHMNDSNPDLIICEFELEDDPVNPLVPPSSGTPELPEDTLQSNPTPEEFAESTENMSRPLRVLRSARRRKGEAAAMEVFNIMSQVQEQLAAAPSLEKFLKVLVGVVKELAGFHRVMIYQFDQAWNGKVVTELVDPRATKDLYKGLNFPASDIPKQARDLYKINRVRLLYDRDQETARLVCRTLEDLEHPLDLTYSYLRAMSPIHLKYLANMAVRSSMSISINAFGELWGLVACHSYGPRGMRVAFPIRKMCRLVGDSASRNIERLSYASRLQARKLINTAPTQHNPSGYIVASSEDLLKLFDADFGLLSIQDETKILGHLEQSQEALAMLEYLRMRKFTSVLSSQDIQTDFPDLRYPPGFSAIAGMLVVPLSAGGNDFIVFFRKGQLREVKWAGNPYEKYIKEGTEGYLEPRKSFKTWSELVVGKCREWTEEEIETAAVLCLVYGKFIEVWRQKEAALQNSQLTRLLLANSAHEVRTPLNAIINYLEIALEGQLDQETRENLAKSHSASKSLIYVINDLLDLTKTEEGADLVRGEVFDLKATIKEATDPFAGDAKRKGISYEVIEHPDLPQQVVGDQRKVRQAISNVTANAIQNTTEGGVKIEIYPVSWEQDRVDIEVAVQDTGAGMNDRKVDVLFRELEQVQTETTAMLEETLAPNAKTFTSNESEKRTLGLGLAIVARIIRNVNGQMRLKSEEGRGSRFVLQFPFELLESETKGKLTSDASIQGTSTQGSNTPVPPPDTQPQGGEVMLVANERDGRSTSNTGSMHMGSMVRKNSADSASSRKSFGSYHSVNSVSSARSGKSDVDRLIDAIQQPSHLNDRRPLPGERSASSRSGRKEQEKRLSHSSAPSSPRRARARSLQDDKTVVPSSRRSSVAQAQAQDSNMGFSSPIKAVKMPGDSATGSPVAEPPPTSRILGEVQDRPERMVEEKKEEPPNARNMRVLVAEDDPVNSKIIQKRLERLGHETYLTSNGEECASAYAERSGFFDVVLMDMQMPIVDGLTSTKMIRSFEKAHPSHLLTTRASLNGRIPIIAVSASLVERQRQSYIDAGFDGWILKPISFPRLNELMDGLVDPSVREKALYKPGDWEKGGWFNKAEPDVFQAKTKPNGRVPLSEPSEDVKIAAAAEDPDAGGAGEGRQGEEQRRLRRGQEEGRREEGRQRDEYPDPDGEDKRKTKSAPDLSGTLPDVCDDE